MGAENNNEGNVIDGAESIRETQSAAPESGKAIPLPPAPPGNVYTGKGANIPEPPTSNPIIGPVLPPNYQEGSVVQNND